MEIFHYYPWLFPTFATLFGLIIGSFLNVVIYRLPKIMEQEWREECADAFPEYQIKPPEHRITLSTPRSSCPHCHQPIRIRDNIPLFSWLLLRGRCSRCNGRISVRYPLVELMSALMSFLIAWQLGFSYFTVCLLFFTFALIALAVIDQETLLLPDQITLPLMWGGILTALAGLNSISLQDSVLGVVTGYGALWVMYWTYKLLTGKEGLGYGDFKLLAALGAWLGWQMLPLIILLASVTGLFFGLIQLRLQKKGMDIPFPFGPHLAIAGWLSVLWGHEIISWYLGALIGF